MAIKKLHVLNKITYTKLKKTGALIAQNSSINGYVVRFVYF